MFHHGLSLINRFGNIRFGFDVVVGHIPEEKRFGWHRGAGGATVFCRYDAGEIVGGEFVASDIDEGADDGSDHVSEKTVGGDDKHVAARLRQLGPTGFRDVAYVCFDVGVEL